MSDIIVFTGPTLPATEAADILRANYRPPAAQGDMYQAFVKYRPAFIGLIDGLFENVPSVWHKEILYCMAQGCHVVGGGSMGALRAAETHLFGMVGAGRIYEGYKSGILEDDDEVAIVHGPENLGYPLLSEAMVNIRATLQNALSEALFEQADYKILIETAKNLHYRQRTYAALINAARGRVEDVVLARLVDWLPHGRYDQKKADAIAVLRQISKMRQSGLGRKIVTYKFENTQTWEAVTAC